MFDRIIKYMKFTKQLKITRNKNSTVNSSDNQSTLYTSLDENIAYYKKVLGKSDDIIFREFLFGSKHPTRAFVCFVDGMGDKNLIIEYIIKSLMVNIHITDPHEKLVDKNNLFDDLKNHILNIVEATEITTFEEGISKILSGNTLLLFEGCQRGFSISAKGGEHRSVQQPETEVVIRGPREAFIETLRINTSMIRRIIKNPNLVFESLTIGKQTNTEMCIAYIDGIANKKIIDEVRYRLNSIDNDSVLESGYIEQMIEDNPLSPFATIGNSERPDKVCSKLLEGRVAILCNGTPVVLTVPLLFIESFHIPDDYYSRPLFTNVIRILRLLAFFITLMLPSLYISLTTFHQEMVPTVLLVTFAAAREGIPFPVFLETIISETIFQLLRESGLRMPRAVGSAVSIVGTLVIGEAAVNAGIIGAPMVIITALSAITGFILPSLYETMLIFKFILILLSGAFGLFGLMIGLICMLAHMCSLRSFGAPYMSPLAPINWRGLKDGFLRFPLWLIEYRPQVITWKKTKRQGNSQMPGINKKGDNENR